MREVREETGLIISGPQLVGIKHFHLRVTGERYLVFLYFVQEFAGTLASSEEGQVMWIPKTELSTIDLAQDMDQVLPLFTNPAISELFYYRDDEDELRHDYF